MAKSAKVKRGSDENLFSISGASTALNRSRRTIAKALEGVKPDAVRSGLALWKMQRIISAIDSRTMAPITRQHRSGDGSIVVLRGVAAECEQAFERYKEAEEAMAALPTLAAKRKAAHEVAELAKEALALMHDRDTECGLHPEHVDLKNQAVLLLVIRGLESVCEWSHSQAWACYNGPDVDDEAA
jgi:hypothetical protein